MDRFALRAFRTVAACLAAAMLAGCTAEPSTTESRTAATIPDGVYRNDISIRELLDAGAPPHDAQVNGGIQTLTIREGTYRIEVKNSPPDCTGIVSVADGRTRFTHGPPPNCGRPGEQLVFDVAWSIEGDQLKLSHFVLQVPDDPALEAGLSMFWTSKPWTIIG